ncbi:MarR family transcriptional regulator [Comamonadaceae bacterium G21597-S1]|nr:MarR family transcriptional regulator [Comamonadaceae bacterium G21597-S1]
MKRSKPASDDITPEGGLEEGGIHELLGYQLAQATIVTTRAFNAVVGEPLNLRPVEFTILQLVHENAPVTATKLSQALAVTRPGITVWLDRLEKRGLLERERNKTDRRTQNLRATVQGKELVNSALAELRKAELATVQHLSEGERRMLLELLHKFALSRAH